MRLISINNFILVFIIGMTQCLTLPAQDNNRLVILHTNDLHSRLEGYAPTLEYSPLSPGDDKTLGGFSRIAAIIEDIRSENPNSTLIVDAGDFLMGTFFHYMEEYNPFQLNLMKDMGYDAMALGNHEFDFGPEMIADLISSSKEMGEIPQLLLSNAEFDGKDVKDDKLNALFKDQTISKATIIERNNLRIGLFSLMGEDADNSAPYARPVRFSKITRAARDIVKDLEAEGCDLIICLSHSGIEKDEDGGWTGEDVELAEKVSGIDLIISGHTHTMLSEPLIINNTPLVQTGSYGKQIGMIEIEVSESGPELVNYKLIKVDDSIAGNRTVQNEIDQQKALISEKLYCTTGYKIDDKIVETDFRLYCDEYGSLTQSNLGPLVADAIYTYTNKHIEGGTDISMVAAGVIRDDIEPGLQTTQDIFRIMSLGKGEDEVPGYPMARVYVNARELKRIIEILLVAYKSTPSNYCYYSGLEVDYNPDKGLLRKVNEIRIMNNEGGMVPVDISKKNPEYYSITANSYMLEFVGIIQKMTFGLVRVKPRDQNGNELIDMSDSILDFNSEINGLQEGKEWIALVEYLLSMKDTDNDEIANMQEYFKNPALCLIPVK